MTELLPGADRPPWRAGACARTPADEKVSLPRELERQKRALEQAYCDLARPRREPTADRHASGGRARVRRGAAANGTLGRPLHERRCGESAPIEAERRDACWENRSRRKRER